MSGPDGQLSGFRALIVEDELLLALELKNLLKELGAHVLDIVPSVQRALAALASERPDFAVLDVNLRGERVTPVAEDLQDRSVPFVLVTGYGRERLPEGPLRGAPCLRKPVDGHRLASAIIRAVRAPGL